MLEVIHIAKSYRGQPVLLDASLTLPPGRSACIVGVNGSGKSTLLSIIAGALPPDAGSVLWNGSPALEQGRAIGFVPQQDTLFDDLSVEDNIAFWASAAGLSKKDAAVRDSLELFGVGDYLSKRVKRLSGGMRRRAALCAALLHDPACILLDEPFTGLDLVGKEELSSYILRLRDRGKAILYTTHNMDEIDLLAQGLIVLYGGRTTLTPLPIDPAQSKSIVMNLIKGAVPNE